MSKPRLRMGLIGFDQEDYLRALLRTRSAVLEWETASAAEADALWINGEAAEWIHEGIVRIAGRQKGASLRLDLQSLDRPTFFTLPLRDERIRPPLSFDPRSAPSIDRALRRAEAVLRPLVVQLAMAHEIAVRMPQLVADTYHVTKGGRLVAIVTMGGTVAMDSHLRAPDLRDASWRPRPRAANAIPQHFFATSFAVVLWLYVSRVQRDLLPRRYREKVLYFRALPRVPQRLMKEAHYAILSELAAEPQTFGQLQQSVGLAEPALANALAALYYAGAITSNLARAAKGAARSVREAESASELRASMFPQAAEEPFSWFPVRASDDRATFPAPLESPPDRGNVGEDGGPISEG
jgi:DNA-binding transcriptional ArsR family regulator